jgi:hypothetical protein
LEQSKKKKKHQWERLQQLLFSNHSCSTILVAFCIFQVLDRVVVALDYFVQI